MAAMNTAPAHVEPPPQRSSPARPPDPQAGFSVSGPRAPLRLVVDRPAQRPQAPQPYGLQGRRHLAGVPSSVQGAQASAPAAEDQGHEPASARRRKARAEPLGFALVLLFSVAAYVVAMRA